MLGKYVQVLKTAGVEGFQIRAMDAAVCALWAICRHWQHPQAAIIAAVRGMLAFQSQVLSTMVETKWSTIAKSITACIASMALVLAQDAAELHLPM